MAGRRSTVVSFVLLAAGLLLLAAGENPNRQPRPTHAPGQRNQRVNPWELDIMMSTGVPGGVFSQPIQITDRAGVSTIVRLPDGRLMSGFQWFPENDTEAFDKIAVRFSSNDGVNWTTPQRVNFGELPVEVVRQFDPTLVVLSDGRVRLYFTGNTNGSPTLDKFTGIHSAVSTDFVNFAYEPGERFGVDSEPVIDCAVARLSGVTHLIAPRHNMVGTALHATSTDGLVFTRQPDIVSNSWQNWTGNLLTDNNQLLFFGTPAMGAPPGGIWTSSSLDGITWSPPTRLSVFGGDPAAAPLSNGTLIITFTGTPNVPPTQRSSAWMVK